jgi:hypothetical protein
MPPDRSFEDQLPAKTFSGSSCGIDSRVNEGQNAPTLSNVN